MKIRIKSKIFFKITHNLLYQEQFNLLSQIVAG